MTDQPKLTVDQIFAAIMLLDQREKFELTRRLPHIIDPDGSGQQEWLQLAESSLEFWDHAEEDIYFAS
jgi:hypothetical protein